jgi:hypothetical protein
MELIPIFIPVQGISCWVLVLHFNDRKLGQL